MAFSETAHISEVEVLPRGQADEEFTKDTRILNLVWWNIFKVTRLQVPLSDSTKDEEEKYIKDFWNFYGKNMIFEKCKII